MSLNIKQCCDDSIHNVHYTEIGLLSEKYEDNSYNHNLVRNIHKYNNRNYNYTDRQHFISKLFLCRRCKKYRNYRLNNLEILFPFYLFKQT